MRQIKRKGGKAMTNKTLSMSAAGVEDEVMPVRGRVVKSKGMRDLLTFLMVVGPGLIVMVADNDAGAVSTYSQAGAQYGTHLLWIVLLLLPATYFIQEMVVRLGIATGKGHAAMIYQRFGKWWGLFSLIDLELVNFLVTEFAAIDLALNKLGVDPRIGVPLVAAGLVLIAVTGSYRRWERIVVFLCLLDLAWFAIAYRMHPAVGEIVRGSLIPGMPPGGLTPDLMFLVIAIVGTTVAPWQLFFQQSCIADKRLRFADMKWARLDTFLGACITITVAGCMMIAGNASHVHGFTFTDPAQMAVDIGSLTKRVFQARDSADDDQRGGAGHDGDLAIERVGVRRGSRLAAQLAASHAQSAGFLRGLPGERGSRRRAGADSARAAATHHFGSAGAGRGDVALGHHLPATVIER